MKYFIVLKLIMIVTISIGCQNTQKIQRETSAACNKELFLLSAEDSFLQCRRLGNRINEKQINFILSDIENIKKSNCLEETEVADRLRCTRDCFDRLDPYRYNLDKHDSTGKVKNNYAGDRCDTLYKRLLKKQIEEL